jgi:rRNA maturation RNase YbeY
MIQFINQTSYSFSKKKLLKAFLKNIFLAEGKSLKSLSFIFCTDNFLIQLNKKYLDHNYFTDILTFDLSEQNEQLTGEIYISVDRIKENAKLYNTLIINELHRIMIHGVLHLCNYNDKIFSEKKLMTARENYYLAKLKECFT